MGDIADMVLEGLLDEQTGEYIGEKNKQVFGNEAPGFPVSYEQDSTLNPHNWGEDDDCLELPEENFENLRLNHAKHLASLYLLYKNQYKTNRVPKWAIPVIKEAFNNYLLGTELKGSINYTRQKQQVYDLCINYMRK